LAKDQPDSILILGIQRRGGKTSRLMPESIAAVGLAAMGFKSASWFNGQRFWP